MTDELQGDLIRQYRDAVNEKDHIKALMEKVTGTPSVLVWTGYRLRLTQSI